VILRIVSHLFVVIIKCRYDFQMVAMGEPDPCGQPHPHKLRYPLNNRMVTSDRKQTNKGKKGLSYILHKMRPFLHSILPALAIL